MTKNKTTTIRTLDGLVDNQLICEENIPQLKQVIDHFSVSITEQMRDAMDITNSQDPIARQFVPSLNELVIKAQEQEDPIGDETFTQTKGLIHRYPDRCLLMPIKICPVYCRFCFRKEKIAASDETLTASELTAAYQYIEQHKEIWEVILTGGDPLILKPATLKKIITRLSQIEHIDIIRIHTRVPLVDSVRINSEMLNALRCTKTVYIALHANHPDEFTSAGINAVAKLIDAGIPMLSQTTLLAGVNDNIAVLSELMRCFVKYRIKPYYLHHGDLARGTSHFRTTIAKGQALMKALRGRFSGICQPTYVLDIPGGHGKVPIGHAYIKETCNHDYQIEDYQGGQHKYFES